MAPEPHLEECLRILKVPVESTRNLEETARLCFTSYRKLSTTVERDDAAFARISRALFYAVRSLVRRRDGPDINAEDLLSLAPNADTRDAFSRFHDFSRHVMDWSDLDATASSLAISGDCPCCGDMHLDVETPISEMKLSGVKKRRSRRKTKKREQVQVNQRDRLRDMWQQRQLAKPQHSANVWPTRDTPIPGFDFDGDGDLEAAYGAACHRHSHSPRGKRKPKKSKSPAPFDPCPVMEPPGMTMTLCRNEHTVSLSLQWHKPETKLDVSSFDLQISPIQRITDAPVDIYDVYSGVGTRYELHGLLSGWSFAARVRCHTFAGSGDWSDWSLSLAKGEMLQTQHPTILDHATLQRQRKRNKRQRKKKDKSQRQRQRQDRNEIEKRQAERKLDQQRQQQERRYEEEAYEKLLEDRRRALRQERQRTTNENDNNENTPDTVQSLHKQQQPEPQPQGRQQDRSQSQPRPVRVGVIGQGNSATALSALPRNVLFGLPSVSSPFSDPSSEMEHLAQQMASLVTGDAPTMHSVGTATPPTAHNAARPRPVGVTDESASSPGARDAARGMFSAFGGIVI